MRKKILMIWGFFCCISTLMSIVDFVLNDWDKVNTNNITYGVIIICLLGSTFLALWWQHESVLKSIYDTYLHEKHESYKKETEGKYVLGNGINRPALYHYSLKDTFSDAEIKRLDERGWLIKEVKYIFTTDTPSIFTGFN